MKNLWKTLRSDKFQDRVAILGMFLIVLIALVIFMMDTIYDVDDKVKIYPYPGEVREFEGSFSLFLDSYDMEGTITYDGWDRETRQY